MLKKRAVKVLLPLLFSFCLLFSGFLSVNTYAYGVDGIIQDSCAFKFVNTVPDLVYWGTGKKEIYRNSSGTINSNNAYIFTSPTTANVKRIILQNEDNPLNFIYLPDMYDTYLYITYTSGLSDTNLMTFTPDNLYLYDTKNPEGDTQFLTKSMSVYRSDDADTTGFTVCVKLRNDMNSNFFNEVHLIDTEGGTVAGYLKVEGLVIRTARTDTDESSRIIQLLEQIDNSINNQTDILSGDIQQAADDIQSTIIDQYSGDPSTQFPIDNIITYHNDKMGVLSFGSDVMLQFLDMFQSANVGTAQLTLPGFNITVENVEYSVWPDYSFNFEQLNEWVPALMSVIRVMLPAFVWLMVLRYCINVFEKNFLAK